MSDKIVEDALCWCRENGAVICFQSPVDSSSGVVVVVSAHGLSCGRHVLAEAVSGLASKLDRAGARPGDRVRINSGVFEGELGSVIRLFDTSYGEGLAIKLDDFEGTFNFDPREIRFEGASAARDCDRPEVAVAVAVAGERERDAEAAARDRIQSELDRSARVIGDQAAQITELRGELSAANGRLTEVTSEIVGDLTSAKSRLDALEEKISRIGDCARAHGEAGRARERGGDFAGAAELRRVENLLWALARGQEWHVVLATAEDGPAGSDASAAADLRIQIPVPGDRELSGLRQIRTGDVTSVSDAEAADLWIDRVIDVVGASRATFDVTDVPSSSSSQIRWSCGRCGGVFATLGDVGDASRAHEDTCPAMSAELARSERDLIRVRDELARQEVAVAELRAGLEGARGDLDRVRAEIASVGLVLDRAGVDACSFAGSRVEMLVKQRDELLGLRDGAPRTTNGCGGGELARSGMDAGDPAGHLTWRVLISELGRLILMGARSSAALDQPVVIRPRSGDGFQLICGVDIEDGFGLVPALVVRAEVAGCAGEVPALEAIMSAHDRYFHFQCLESSCGHGAVVDVRKCTHPGEFSADFTIMKCPFCSVQMDYCGSSVADDDGYKIRQSVGFLRAPASDSCTARSVLARAHRPVHAAVQAIWHDIRIASSRGGGTPERIDSGSFCVPLWVRDQLLDVLNNVDAVWSALLSTDPERGESDPHICRDVEAIRRSCRRGWVKSASGQGGQVSP